jgi:hypothetical protein
VWRCTLVWRCQGRSRSQSRTRSSLNLGPIECAQFRGNELHVWASKGPPRVTLACRALGREPRGSSNPRRIGPRFNGPHTLPHLTPGCVKRSTEQHNTRPSPLCTPPPLHHRSRPLWTCSPTTCLH